CRRARSRSAASARGLAILALQNGDHRRFGIAIVEHANQDRVDLLRPGQHLAETGAYVGAEPLELFGILARISIGKMEVDTDVALVDRAIGHLCRTFAGAQAGDEHPHARQRHAPLDDLAFLQGDFVGEHAMLVENTGGTSLRDGIVGSFRRYRAIGPKFALRTSPPPGFFIYAVFAEPLL